MRLSSLSSYFSRLTDSITQLLPLGFGYSHHLLDKIPYSGDGKTYRMFIEQLLDSVK